jgi:hypothetical protein
LQRVAGAGIQGQHQRRSPTGLGDGYPQVGPHKALQTEHRNTAATSAEEIGRGALKLVVTGVRQMTPRVRAYELRAPTGASCPPSRQARISPCLCDFRTALLSPDSIR